MGLSAEEQKELKGLLSRRQAAAYKQTHARILLLVDESQEGGVMRDEETARVLKVGSATVELVLRRCVEEGVEAVLRRRQQVNWRPRKLDGDGEARQAAMACSQPPDGRAARTLQLLADGLVESEIEESIQYRNGAPRLPL